MTSIEHLLAKLASEFVNCPECRWYAVLCSLEDSVAIRCHRLRIVKLEGQEGLWADKVYAVARVDGQELPACIENGLPDFIKERVRVAHEQCHDWTLATSEHPMMVRFDFALEAM